MSVTSAPPRFVPTLTDVVAQPHLAYTPALNDVATGPAAAREDQLIKRVMQRVDVVLERRLREAVSRVVVEHTQAMVPRLREEIEGVVKDSIAQALAQESGRR